METTPECLLENLRTAKAEVVDLEAALVTAQAGRDEEIAAVHAKWEPALKEVQESLDAARQSARNAQLAIDDATNPPPSAKPETEEPSGDAQVLVVTGMSEDGRTMTVAPLSSISAEEPHVQ